MGMEVCPADRAKKYQAPIKLAQPFPALELRAEHFTDMVFYFRDFARILGLGEAAKSSIICGTIAAIPPVARHLPSGRLEASAVYRSIQIDYRFQTDTFSGGN